MKSGVSRAPGWLCLAGLLGACGLTGDGAGQQPRLSSERPAFGPVKCSRVLHEGKTFECRGNRFTTHTDEQRGRAVVYAADGSLAAVLVSQHYAAQCWQDMRWLPEGSGSDSQEPPREPPPLEKGMTRYLHPVDLQSEPRSASDDGTDTGWYVLPVPVKVKCELRWAGFYSDERAREPAREEAAGDPKAAKWASVSRNSTVVISHPDDRGDVSWLKVAKGSDYCDLVADQASRYARRW